MADERTDAQAWADAEPLCSVEHGLRRIRIVSGQTHFSPRERLERVLEMAQRSVELLPAEEKRLAKERKEIERRDRALKDRERVILENTARAERGEDPLEVPELPPDPPVKVKPPGEAELAALAALERGGEPEPAKA